MKIAKSYPQALYLQLRTINEEYKLVNISPAGSSTPVQGESTDSKFTSNSPNPSTMSDSNGLQNLVDKSSMTDSSEMDSNSSDQPFSKKPPHEHTEDLIGILKTGLSFIGSQSWKYGWTHHSSFEIISEEDLYRIITSLITENIQVRFNCLRAYF